MDIDLLGMLTQPLLAALLIVGLLSPALLLVGLIRLALRHLQGSGRGSTASSADPRAGAGRRALRPRDGPRGSCRPTGARRRLTRVLCHAFRHPVKGRLLVRDRMPARLRNGLHGSHLAVLDLRWTLAGPRDAPNKGGLLSSSHPAGPVPVLAVTTSRPLTAWQGSGRTGRRCEPGRP